MTPRRATMVSAAWSSPECRYTSAPLDLPFYLMTLALEEIFCWAKVILWENSVSSLFFKYNVRYSGCFRVCVCDSWKARFLPRFIFNWSTFSRWVTARWWCQWPKNLVWTNQNSENRWCYMLIKVGCLLFT